MLLRRVVHESLMWPSATDADHRVIHERCVHACTPAVAHTLRFTECEYTCFHFDVNPEHLQPAMDRLAHFFVSPLLREEAAAREVRSVNSEFDQVCGWWAPRGRRMQT